MPLKGQLKFFKVSDEIVEQIALTRAAATAIANTPLIMPSGQFVMF